MHLFLGNFVCSEFSIGQTFLIYAPPKKLSNFAAFAPETTHLQKLDPNFWKKAYQRNFQLDYPTDFK